MKKYNFFVSFEDEYKQHCFIVASSITSAIKRACYKLGLPVELVKTAYRFISQEEL